MTDTVGRQGSSNLDFSTLRTWILLALILAKILENRLGTYLEQFWKCVQKLALAMSWLALAISWLALAMGQALGPWAGPGPEPGPGPGPALANFGPGPGPGPAHGPKGPAHGPQGAQAK